MLILAARRGARHNSTLAIMQTRAELTPIPPNPIGRIVPLAAICHAAVVTTLWWLMIYQDRDFVSARAWLAIAWAWVLWPIVVAFVWARISWLGLALTAVGAVILLPAVSTVYSFSAWLIGGFAP